MLIEKIEVKGELGFTLQFGKVNVVLGENKTGKSTLLKLMIYALGTKVDSFIDEISKFDKCKQVELDIKLNNEKRFRIIRRLPHSDSIILIPFNGDGILVEEEMEVLSLQEYSDFLLSENFYKNQQIVYGYDKKSSMRFYYLLRAVVIDQDTSAYKIFSDLGGREMDYINNQVLIKKAIIDEFIGKENEQIQKIRLELQNLQLERKDKSSKLNVIEEIIKQIRDENRDLIPDLIDISDRLEKVESEKIELSNARAENLSAIKEVNNSENENQMRVLKDKEADIISQIRIASLEKSDILSVIEKIEKEIEQLKRMITAKQVITKIPVDSCPICLKQINLEEEIAGICPFCKRPIEENDLDNILHYKKMLEESLTEAKQIIISMDQNTFQIQKEKLLIQNRLTMIRKNYFDKLLELKNPFEELIYSIAMRLGNLTKEEEILRNFQRNLNYRDVLREDKIDLESKVKMLRSRLEDLESLLSSREVDKFSTWLDIFEEEIRYIFEDITNVSLDDNYLPIIDNSEVRALSSASLKVVVRLCYILSLFQLKDHTQINHVGFVFFDSPKDKDLDIDKYNRFLELLANNQTGQIFITGSITEKELYNQLGILRELTKTNKLLLKM